MEHASPLQMTYIMLFRENGDLVLLQGEKNEAPDICTLVGGKVGDENNGLNEKFNPYIALFRELDEELGHPVLPRNLSKAFDYSCPYKETSCMVHVFSGTISDKEFSKLAPPQGTVVTLDIHSLHDDPIKNDNMPVSPLHNRLIQLFKDHDHSKEEYADEEHHILVIDFQKAISMQRRLKAA